MHSTEQQDTQESPWNEPLTPEELSRGLAFRIVDCALSDPSYVVLDVRCVIAKPGPHRIVIRGPKLRQPPKGCRVVLRSTHEVACPPGWPRAFEEQYAVILPEDALGVSLFYVAGPRRIARASLSRDDRLGLLYSYYERIRNPFADPEYPQWWERHCASAEELDAQRATDQQEGPLLSVVCPLYRTPERYLREMIDSVVAQTYRRWELVLVNASPDDEAMRGVLASYDDSRIRVLDHPENDGINGNTNAGIAICQGDYVGFIDHDDTIAPDAIWECARAVREQPDTDLLYTDEDSFENDGLIRLPLFKPEFGPDLLLSNDFILHFLFVSRRILDLTERSGEGTSGAQDYDLVFKATEHARRITHVTKVLYHWRIHESSTNMANLDSKPYAEIAGAKVIKAHLARLGYEACVESEPTPFTFRSIVQPRAARSVTVVTDEGDRGALERLSGFCDLEGVTLRRLSTGIRALGLATARNWAAEQADTELLLFLSSGDMPQGQDFVDVLRSYLERPEVGVVAPELHLPDGQRVDAGWVVCADGSITRISQGLPAWDGGYVERSRRPSNWTAVNPAIQMVRRAEFLELGGYSGDYASLAYASVDLCLRYRERGQFVTYTPFAKATHSEPLQRRFAPLTPEELRRLDADQRLLRERWLGEGWVDPFSNPNVRQDDPYYLLAW